MRALALWEACILPSLLNNCGTWISINETTIKKLDGLQNLLVLALLKMPQTTPQLSTRAMTGQLGMGHRIWKEKLNLVAAIKKLEENTLAKEVLNDHLKLGLPGLVQEAQEISEKIGIQDITKNEVTKEEINEALETHHLNHIGKRWVTRQSTRS